MAALLLNNCSADAPATGALAVWWQVLPWAEDFDLFQDSAVLLRRGLGQAFKEDIRGFQIATKDLQPDAGVEFVRKVYALGKQGCPPDGAGADVVFPCDALAGFLGGLLVVILICSL